MIVAISGADKDVGKSSLAAFLISRGRDCAAAKFSVHGEEPPGEAIVEETASGADNDTSRMLRAGASPVYWVRATRETLPGLAAEVLRRVGGKDLVLEGNSVLEHLQADYSVFIMGPGFDGFKPSAWPALRRADSVLVNGEGRLTGEEAVRLEREIKSHNPGAKVIFLGERGREEAYSIVLSRIAGREGGGGFVQEKDERVAAALRERAADGRIPCAEALALAEELGVPTLEVGKAANELGIKIVNCSLGCF